MLSLNIIPGELKKEIQLSNIYRLFKKLILSLSVIMLFSANALLAIELMMQADFVTTVHQSDQAAKKTENVSAKIKEINNQLNAIEKIQADAVNWSYLIEYISKRVNDGVSFTRIVINQRTGSMTMSGFAAERDDVLSLKQLIEESGFFSEVDFPIKNLLERNNINFEISMKFDNYDFEKLQF